MACENAADGPFPYTSANPVRTFLLPVCSLYPTISTNIRTPPGWVALRLLLHSSYFAFQRCGAHYPSWALLCRGAVCVISCRMQPMQFPTQDPDPQSGCPNLCSTLYRERNFFPDLCQEFQGAAFKLYFRDETTRTRTLE